MKIGTTAHAKTGKTASESGRTAEASPDDQIRQLAEMADAARRDMIDKAGLQTSLKNKLLSSRDRADEIRQRIQNGYYNRPEILRSIADRMAEDLQP